ncbi:MAG: AAA family ATPase [Flavobacteriales bacterium]
MLNQIFIEEKPQIELQQVHFDTKNQKLIDEFLKEYRHQDVLSAYGLPVCNKLLLFGASGCGKTMTSKAIAKHLDKKLISLNLAGIISSKLGESSKNIHSIFAKAQREKSVLFFDEFDSVGQSRTEQGDSGELKRVVNTLLQGIDYMPNDTLLIAATNRIDQIDSALLRRFDTKIEFQLPNNQQLDLFYNQHLASFPKQYQNINRQYGISYAEAKISLQKQVKALIIHEQEKESNSI